IGWKIVGRLEIHSDQVANGVVVLVAVEAPDGRATGVAGQPAVRRRGRGVDPGQDQLPLGIGWLRLALWRDLLRLDLLADFRPQVAGLQGARGVLVWLKGHATGHLLVVVAGDAELGEDGANGVREWIRARGLLLRRGGQLARGFAPREEPDC